jgi:hypothetical protein
MTLVDDSTRAAAIASELYQATHHLHAALEGLREADAHADVQRHLDQCTASIHNAALLIDPTRGSQ